MTDLNSVYRHWKKRLVGKTINGTIKTAIMQHSIRWLYFFMAFSLATGIRTEGQGLKSPVSVNNSVVFSDSCLGNFTLANWNDFNFNTGRFSVLKTRNLQTKGKIILTEGFNTILTASEQINLLPGFSAVVGSRLSAYIDPVECAGKSTIAAIENKSGGLPNAQLFPNPNNGNFLVVLSPKGSSLLYDISIISVDGRLIEERRGQTGSRIRFGLEQFGRGVFLVRIFHITTGMTETLKVITQ